MLTILLILALCTAIGWFLGHPVPGLLVGVLMALIAAGALGHV